MDEDGAVAFWFAVVLLALLLAGCATVPTILTTEVRTVEVVKPVPVSCIKAADIPPKTQTAMPPPEADVGAKAAGASADVRQLENENAQLRAALLACSTLGDPKP